MPSKPSSHPSAQQPLRTSHRRGVIIALNTRATFAPPLVAQLLVKHDPHLNQFVRRLFSTESDMHAAYNSAASLNPSPTSPSSQKASHTVPPSFAKDASSWSAGSSRTYSCPGVQGGSTSKLATALRIISMPFRALLKVAAWCVMFVLGWYLLLLALSLICFLAVAVYILIDYHFLRDVPDATSASEIAPVESSPARKDASPATTATGAPVSNAASTRHPSATPVPPQRGPVSGAASAVATIARNLGL